MKKHLQQSKGVFSKLYFILIPFLIIVSSIARAQAPAAPTDFQAVQVGYTIELNWTDNADNETAFIIQKEWTDEFSNNIQITLPANTQHYVDTEVQPNITYFYSLWAENEFGSSTDVSVVGIVNVEGPPAPASVSATAGPLMSVEVTFTDNSDLETYYEIHHTNIPDDYFGLEQVNGGILNSVITHYISDGPYNTSGPPPPDQIFYVANTTVYVKVRAVINDNGTLIYGPFSPVVTAVTNPVPATPTNFIATPEGNNVHLTWTDNSISEAAYFLAKFQGEFSPNQITLIKLLPNTTEYTDANVSTNVEYQYWLMAIDDFEYTAWPPEFWGELFTLDDSRVAKTSITVLELPAAPTDLAAIATSPTSMLVTFTDGSDVEFWYELLVSTTPEESSAIQLLEGASPVLGSEVQIEVIDLVPGTTYYFRVRGVFELNNSVTYGPYSAVISGSTPSLIPEPPIAGPATSITPKSFVANWSEVEGATYYELDVFDNKDRTYVSGFQGKIVYETSTSVANLKKSASHYSYIVRAVNENGESGNSNTIAVGNVKNASLTQSEILAGQLSGDVSICNYPNPVTDKFQILISSPDEDTAELQIMSSSGSRVLTKNVQTNTRIEVDANSYPPGMYILKAMIGRNARMIKVIKQ